MRKIAMASMIATSLLTAGCSSTGGFHDFGTTTYHPHHYPPPYRGDATSDVVHCSSEDQRFRRCDVRLSHRDSVHIIQRESRAECRHNRDWGTDRGAIWVDNGCRATFHIERYYRH